MENKCENLTLYMIDELSKQERKHYEQHLKTCRSCQNELNSLQETWQMLSYDMEGAEVPETLKTEVMNFIFDDVPLKAPAAIDKKQTIFQRLKLQLRNQFSPLSAVTTIILILGMFGLYWKNIQLNDFITAVESEVHTPSQIVKTFTLKGQNIASSANGMAYLLENGNHNNLIIELNNMPGTKRDEVYQVWLLKDGDRHNAGILKPDENGNGFITYRLPKDQTFNDIGITLEPNPNNTQPQGGKVMGTS
ncbi:anti-sigma factor [Solibacillus daqui]|uniref:anti-sigma factor n=1 Tax=Solibacillus daqui TaxID=2912187 RepID=UPI0023665A09|nr:anti-sigma factor [Solibacillus daqui]